jgi:hypothetical protein
MSAATRERVRETIDRLGYAPNLLAKSLALNRSAAIGLLVGNLAHLLSTPVIEGVEAAVVGAACTGWPPTRQRRSPPCLCRWPKGDAGPRSYSSSAWPNAPTTCSGPTLPAPSRPPSHTPQVILPTELIVRVSTAPPPTAHSPLVHEP